MRDRHKQSVMITLLALATIVVHGEFGDRQGQSKILTPPSKSLTYDRTRVPSVHICLFATNRDKFVQAALNVARGIATASNSVALTFHLMVNDESSCGTAARREVRVLHTLCWFEPWFWLSCCFPVQVYFPKIDTTVVLHSLSSLGPELIEQKHKLDMMTTSYKSRAWVGWASFIYTFPTWILFYFPPPDTVVVETSDVKAYMWKPMLHLILKDEKRVIVLDTDLVLLQSIAGLWRIFNDFSAGQFIGIASEQQPTYEACWKSSNNFVGFNGGVQLLDLQKMRRSKAYNKLLVQLPDILKHDVVEKEWLRGCKHSVGSLGDQTFYA